MMNNPRTEPQVPRVSSMQWTHPRPASTSQGGTASCVTDEAQFQAALPVINDVVGKICRRHRLSPIEADEFRSDVHLHFIDRNYEVLRRFEGRSTLTTYVTVVVQHVFLDRRNRQWGKWRPSADARRLGPNGILLDRLMTRDGCAAEQALEMLEANHGVAIDDHLRALADRLGRREPTRQLVPEDEAEDVPGRAPSPEDNVVRAEQDFLAKRIQTALDRARQSLTHEEQLILRMRFDDGVAVADIARALHLNQRRLYRTIDRLLATIKSSLAADGIAETDVSALFAEGVLGSDQDREAGIDATAGLPARPAERGGLSWLHRR